MTSRDHLHAAARCWERAGFFEEAAERFSAAEAWHEAGRCFSQAESHSDAALAYSRAGEPLLEAREYLMAAWPERARSVYERLRSEAFFSPSLKAEVLFGLGDPKKATYVALTSCDNNELGRLACLTNARRRPDLAVPIWSQVDRSSWETFAPWNRFLALRGSGSATEQSWPMIEFGRVSLVPVWEENTGTYPSWGDRALDWSMDSQSFVAALNTHGLARGNLGHTKIHLSRLKLPRAALSARVIPGKLSALVGLQGGEVWLCDGLDSSKNLHPLRMPESVWQIAFSPRGDRVAILSWRNSGVLLKIFNWNNGGPGAEIRAAREAGESGADCVPVCAWAPEPDRGVAWCPNPGGPTRLILGGPKSRLEVIAAHRQNVTSLTFTPNCRFLISTSWDQTVAVRDGQNGQVEGTANRLDHRIYGASVHPRAPLVAVAEGKCIHLLRLEISSHPRLSMRLLQNTQDNVKALSFSPDGRYLLVMTQRHLLLFRVDLRP